VIGVLSHELVHAALPNDVGHGDEFKKACKQLGLEGRATSALPGLELQKKLDVIAEEIGDYPHPHIILEEKQKNDKPKKKATFKLHCSLKRACDKRCSLLDKAIGDDYNVNATSKKLELGFPMCPCGNEMIMEEEDFLLYQQQGEAKLADLRD
jgi:hypothetical protein